MYRTVLWMIKRIKRKCELKGKVGKEYRLASMWEGFSEKIEKLENDDTKSVRVSVSLIVMCSIWSVMVWYSDDEYIIKFS
jgi:hypothetical protein